MSNKKNIFKQLIIGTLLIGSMVLVAGPITADAVQGDQKVQSNLDTAAQYGFGITKGTDTPTIGTVIGRIATAILAFTGTVAFIIFLVGGFMWLTARGDDDQVTKARKFLMNGSIGVIIVVLAYSISYFITNVVYKAVN